MAFPYMEAVVGFMIFMYFFETYFDIRQHKALKLPTLPKTLEGVISQDKFLKSRAYSLDKSYFHFVHEFVTILMDSTILYFRVLPWFWKKSEHLVTLVGLNAENEILHTLGFLAGVMIWSQITDLPFSLYSTFVIEARHGFNKQPIWLFFRDMIKGMLIAIVIGPPIVAAIIVIVQKGSPYLAIYLWGFMLVLSLVMMTIYPVLIAPLFNKFTPLPEGTLREKIEKLAASLKFPLKKLFVVDGSTRSSHSNAYMYGFFKNKRIVLYDTLIQQCKNDDEVVAVIAHELGHWKLNHTVYSFVAVQHTVIPIQHLVSFGLNLVSRSFEFQADAFAKKLGYAAELRAGLVKLQEENLSAMNTDPWYSAYHYSHPPLVERMLQGGKEISIIYNLSWKKQFHSTQTIWLFFRDMIKGMLIAIVIGPPIVAAVIVMMQKGSPYLAIYLWGFILVLSLVMMTIYPVLIAPLFNKFTPLPEGTLREKIEKLAASLKFPLKKLFVVDGSTRSTHSNAYMYGFFKNKRIVLYDTLIQQYKNDDEVVAVIAHELGHWKLNHTLYGFVLFQYTVIPIQHLVSFGLNLVSRSFEFQADAFAKKLGYAAELRAALVKLQEENLSAMNTDPWYSAYHYSHPPLVERLAAIDKSDKKEK
ncbi:hypothetical protein Ahy_A02g009861 [Arachis hypogaea]|uniref:CAAX prenyl protease 1 homolog n=1 Tax=Arachis hypogaea TaxID=3818 RepID=A0A445EIE6_ARAHY|nr:hypothetical protein Ahy_A02g009861 [Arachis hypogaea]